MVSTRQKVDPVPGQPAPPASTHKDWNAFFNVPEAYLTVSGQLDAEIFACSMGRVYTFGPTFRAEKSNTPRHLAEFWMVEPEVAFLDLEGDMQLAERFIKNVVREISEKCRDDIAFFEKWVDPQVASRIAGTLTEPFARVNYTEAVDILKKANHVREPKFFKAFQTIKLVCGFNILARKCRRSNGVRILNEPMSAIFAKSILSAPFLLPIGPRKSSRFT